MTRKEEKQQLRRTIRAMERELSPKYKEESGRAICQNLIAMPAYQSADTVFCFVGMSREIDTTLILEDALKAGKRLCVPLCVGDGIMELRHITALDQLIPGAYGILEPGPDTPLVETDEVDFAVLPCVSCNHAGQRLGQGGGFYDRFLTRYRSSMVLLCREKLIRDEIPLEPHDYPIPWVLTERGLYEDGIPAQLG